MTEQNMSPSQLSTIRPKCREDARCLEDPSPNSKSRPKERKTLQFASGNSEDDDDVPDAPPRHTSKAKSNAKVGQTQHSTRHRHGTSKRAADPENMRKGETQHSPAKKSHHSPSIRCTTSPLLPGERKNVHEPQEARHEALQPRTQNVSVVRTLVGGKVLPRQVLQIAFV